MRQGPSGDCTSTTKTAVPLGIASSAVTALNSWKRSWAMRWIFPSPLLAPGIPSATVAGLSEYLWKLEQPAAAVANEYFIGAINRVGIEDLGDDDFYGTSYFVDPQGAFVGEVADTHSPELVIRDLDLELLTEVRNRWAFYRDRRPEAYGDLVQP